MGPHNESYENILQWVAPLEYLKVRSRGISPWRRPTYCDSEKLAEERLEAALLQGKSDMRVFGADRPRWLNRSFY
ncbi:hypothetical protein ACFX15_005520 [Malus domestica]